MSTEIAFIVIDDNELDCYIAKKAIEHTDKRLITETFNNAQHALDAIRAKYYDDGNDSNSTIILLDLKMPLMDGLKFVEEFEQFPSDIQEKYIIIILTIFSQAKYPNDIFRMLNHASVSKMIEKPLTKEKLFALLSEIKPDTFKNS